MRKRIFLSLFALLLLVGLNSCKKRCEERNAICNDTPPTDEACQAVFQRWFYNKASNTCEQITYSGCSQKGFATQQECESCKNK